MVTSGTRVAQQRAQGLVVLFCDSSKTGATTPEATTITVEQHRQQ